MGRGSAVAPSSHQRAINKAADLSCRTLSLFHLCFSFRAIIRIVAVAAVTQKKKKNGRISNAAASHLLHEDIKELEEPWRKEGGVLLYTFAPNYIDAPHPPLSTGLPLLRVHSTRYLCDGPRCLSSVKGAVSQRDRRSGKAVGLLLRNIYTVSINATDSLPTKW